jgi:prepilin-type processing-associated H-X9-DG protein
MNRGIIVTKAAVLALVILLAGSTAGLAAGQSSLEKLLSAAPDDVFGIVGTSGGDEVGPAFKETVIGKMWADQQTQVFFTQVRDTIIGKIQEASSTKDANQITMLIDTAKLVFARPRFAGVAARPAVGDQIPAYFFVIVDAGPVKDEFAARIKKVEGIAGWGDIKDTSIAGCKVRAMMPSDGPAVYWGMQGNYFVLAINDSEGLALKHLKTGGSSAISLLNKVKGNGDVLAAYVDIAKVKALLQTQFGSNKDYPKVMAFIKSMGLDNVKTYVSRTGFVGGEVVTESFIDAPQPRTGILAAVKPINMKVFDMVDVNCIDATAMNVDTAAIFDTIMGSIKGVDENGYKEVTEGLAKFETEANFKVRDGIIASLAGPVTVYTVPGGVMDMTLGGAFVIIADLKDQAKFEQNMAALGAYITKESNGSLQISTQTLGERKLNVWMVPQMSMMGFVPTWTVAGGKLVFANSQQMCKNAADRVASPVAAKSVSSLPQFRAVTAGLPAGVTYVGYLDSRLYFKMMMGQLQRYWPMATMFASQAGVALPYVLPDLSQYESQMKPGVAYSWSDKDGIHTHVKGSGIEQAVGCVAGAAIGAAVLMPAMAKAKEKAKDVTSINNLRQIGMAMMMYADKSKGAYPKELADLVKDGGLSPKALECNRKPKGFAGPDYIYVAGLTSKAPATTVLAYENPGFCNNGKLNVLYGDGHVEMVDKTRFREDLKKTYETLGQPVPTVKFGNKSGGGAKKKDSPKPAEPNKP